MDPSLEARRSDFQQLSAATLEGFARIARLQDTVRGTSQEFHAVGVEMNQRYESRAVYAADEKARPPLPNNSILEHEITTYPGSRLPHAWLNTKIPGKQFSTIDLAPRREVLKMAVCWSGRTDSLVGVRTR